MDDILEKAMAEHTPTHRSCQFHGPHWPHKVYTWRRNRYTHSLSGHRSIFTLDVRTLLHINYQLSERYMSYNNYNCSVFTAIITIPRRESSTITVDRNQKVPTTAIQKGAWLVKEKEEEEKTCRTQTRQKSDTNVCQGGHQMDPKNHSKQNTTSPHR